MPIHFEPTIDLGSIIALGGAISALYMFHSSNVKRIAKMEVRFNIVWNYVKNELGIKEDIE